MTVRGAGIYNFNGVRWRVELLDWKDGMPLKEPAGTLIADAAKLAFPFVCRKWKQGDWLIPLGMRGRKKVSDMFVDLKYGTFEKEAALMMVDCRGNLAEDQHIAGVLGVRLDEAFKVDDNTKSIIRMTILDNTETL
jgi:tRNA(Ile)-lysidine synthase